MTYDIFNPPQLGPAKGWNNAMLAPAGGRVLFIAGQTARNADGEFPAGGFVEQFAAALDNVLVALEAAGGTPADIGRMSLYVTDVQAYRDSLKELDQSIITKPGNIGEKGVTCKILGLGCDDYKGIDTNWLVINSLKAIGKFGKRVEPLAGFETEFIDLTTKKIRPCLNCDHYTDMPHGGKRWKGDAYPAPDTYGCVIKHDYFAEEVLPRYAEADGVIYGSSVCALAPSTTFRLFAERLVRGIWTGWNNLKPTANIAVSYDLEGGHESCLNIMNTCNRWVEALPVSWPHGTRANGNPLESDDIVVKDDPIARSLSVINARRVAEFAMVKKLAQQEIGEELYKREFYFVLHPPHGNATWEWSRLDKEEEEYMLNLSPNDVAELGK